MWATDYEQAILQTTKVICVIIYHYFIKEKPFSLMFI